MDLVGFHGGGPMDDPWWWGGWVPLRVPLGAVHVPVHGHPGYTVAGCGTRPLHR